MFSEAEVLLARIATEQLAMRRGLLQAHAWESTRRHDVIHQHQEKIDSAFLQLLDMYGDVATLLVNDVLSHTDYVFEREQARLRLKARLSRHFYEQANTQLLQTVHVG